MATKKMDAFVDEAVEQTFPASDPPSYMAGALVPGSPSRSGFVRQPPFTALPNADEDSSEVLKRRIRERAYFLWEQEGRPEGRAGEHWRRRATATSRRGDKPKRRQAEEETSRT